MASAASSSRQAEAFSVRLIGAPLRRGSGNGPLEAELEVIFEVRGEEGRRPPWKVQRGYREIARLHQQLVNDVPWAALPRFPECAKPAAGMKRFFRSKSEPEIAEDQQLRGLAEQLEEYLNTLLAMPDICDCSFLHLFLDIPQHVTPAQPQAPTTATEMGEHAAETVADSCSAMCQACRAFCFVLFQRQLIVEETPVDDGTSLCGGPPAINYREGSSSRNPSFTSNSLRRANASTTDSPAGSFISTSSSSSRREVVLPLDGKLEEWK